VRGGHSGGAGCLNVELTRATVELMGSEKLAHLIYTSAAVKAFDIAELKAILELARTKNAKASVTGMLLYSAGNFFQVLEGDEVALNALFLTIAADPRHKRVTRIIDEPIAQRDFGDWSMGFAEASPAEITSIEGFSDYFQDGNSFTNLQPGRAKKLLSAFADGRWRRGLTSNAA
jgi:hypothetical protein